MTNGMKPGAGSNPLEDDSDDEDTDTGTEETSILDETAETSTESSGLPWIYKRDGVKSARDHTYQLHLRDETRQQEKRFQADIEERLGEDVYKADLREAALLAAMENLDDVVDQLRDWGYDA